MSEIIWLILLVIVFFFGHYRGWTDRGDLEYFYENKMNRLNDLISIQRGINPVNISNARPKNPGGSGGKL